MMRNCVVLCKVEIPQAGPALDEHERVAVDD